MEKIWESAAINKSAEIRGEEYKGFYTEQWVDDMRENATITKSAQL